MVLGFMLKRGVYYIPLLYLYHQFFLLFSHPSCLNWLKFDNQGKSLFHYYDCNAFCKNNPFHPSSEFVGIMYYTLYCTVLKIKKYTPFLQKLNLIFLLSSASCGEHGQPAEPSACVGSHRIRPLRRGSRHRGPAHRRPGRGGGQHNRRLGPTAGKPEHHHE